MTGTKFQAYAFNELLAITRHVHIPLIGKTPSTDPLIYQTNIVYTIRKAWVKPRIYEGKQTNKKHNFNKFY